MSVGINGPRLFELIHEPLENIGLSASKPTDSRSRLTYSALPPVSYLESPPTTKTNLELNKLASLLTGD